VNRALDAFAYVVSGVLVIAGVVNLLTFAVFGMMLGLALLGVGTLTLQVTRLKATNDTQVAALELLLQRQQRNALRSTPTRQE